MSRLLCQLRDGLRFAKLAILGPLAQLVEQLTLNQQVTGSIPVRLIKKRIIPCGIREEVLARSCNLLKQVTASSNLQRWHIRCGISWKSKKV